MTSILHVEALEILETRFRFFKNTGPGAGCMRKQINLFRTLYSREEMERSNLLMADCFRHNEGHPENAFTSKSGQVVQRIQTSV